jgi:hypothetical protein
MHNRSLDPAEGKDRPRASSARSKCPSPCGHAIPLAGPACAFEQHRIGCRFHALADRGQNRAHAFDRERRAQVLDACLAHASANFPNTVMKGSTHCHPNKDSYGSRTWAFMSAVATSAGFPDSAAFLASHRKTSNAKAVSDKWPTEASIMRYQNAIRIRDHGNEWPESRLPTCHVREYEI